MPALTSEQAGDIIDQLSPTLDVCRSIIVDHQNNKAWRKATSDGRSETVTDLDLIVERQLIAAIRAIESDASIFSEESAHDASALDDDLCFVVDPIDGTDLLIAGETGYSISVAILSAHRVMAGLLDFPARDQRLTCRSRGGATLNGHPLRPHGRTSLEYARIAVSSTQRARPSLEPLWSTLRVGALVPTPGFTAKVASVLTGECDAALYLPVDARPTFIWDYAAAALLLQETESRLTTLDGHSFLDTLPIQHSDGWLAGPNSLHPTLQAAVIAALRELSNIQ